MARDKQTQPKGALPFFEDEVSTDERESPQATSDEAGFGTDYPWRV